MFNFNWELSEKIKDLENSMLKLQEDVKILTKKEVKLQDETLTRITDRISALQDYLGIGIIVQSPYKMVKFKGGKKV